MSAKGPDADRQLLASPQDHTRYFFNSLLVALEYLSQLTFVNWPQHSIFVIRVSQAATQLRISPPLAVHFWQCLNARAY